jgi:hypothetical protein
MVAEHHAQAVSTTASLVAQAQACAYHQVALRDLASLLPEQDEVLERALEEAVQQRDERAFTHLLLAALSASRNVDAHHLREGAALFLDLDTLWVAATHCTGDVSEGLLGAARSGRLGWEREAAALLLAAWWCQTNRDGEMPAGLLGQARTLARKTLFDAEVQFLLLALSDILQDETLLVNSKMLSTLALKTIVKARKKPANALDESRSQRLESGARRINQQSRMRGCPACSAKWTCRGVGRWRLTWRRNSLNGLSMRCWPTCRSKPSRAG